MYGVVARPLLRPRGDAELIRRRERRVRPRRQFREGVANVGSQRIGGGLQACCFQVLASREDRVYGRVDEKIEIGGLYVGPAPAQIRARGLK